MPDRKSIAVAIHEGIRDANRKFETWSNGEWVTEWGVEGLVVAGIAERLNSKMAPRESLLMEVPFSAIIDWSGAGRGPGRRREKLRGTNRADIVLFNGGDKPVCVIEAKRSWNQDRCFHDLERIRDLVRQCNNQRNGSLRRGFLAVMLAKPALGAKSAKQRIEEQADQIENSVTERLDLRGLKARFYRSAVRNYPEQYRDAYDSGEWAHASFCIELSGG